MTKNLTNQSDNTPFIDLKLSLPNIRNIKGLHLPEKVDSKIFITS